MNISVLIPSYKPDGKLIPLLRKLAAEPFDNIVVVDDGGGSEYSGIFDQLKKIPKTVVVKHETNRGKGAALKTGFAFIRDSYPNCIGIVSADADGQHKPADIVRVARALEQQKDALVLGARVFSGDVPLRSKIGNNLTRLLFRIFFRLDISDTQSGLRGIPLGMIPQFLAIPYNRYEYESEMLLSCSKNRLNLKIQEVPIETVYENNNAGSHFNPLIDSARIYFVLLRYTLASLASAAVDFIVFISVYPLVGNVLIATYAARTVSLFVNYGLVSRTVFYSKDKARQTFPKYLLLVIVSGFISSMLISYLHAKTDIPIGLAKIITESFLYIINFYVQKKIIFKQIG